MCFVKTRQGVPRSPYLGMSLAGLTKKSAHLVNGPILVCVLYWSGKCYGKGTSTRSLEELVAQGRCANIHVVGVYCPNCDPTDFSGGNTTALSGSPGTPTYKRRLTIASRTLEVSVSPPISVGGENLHLQSEEMILDNTTSADPDAQEAIVGFSDESAGVKVDLGSIPNYIKCDTSQNVELGDFLSRPVLIASLTWTEGASFNAYIQPWSQFFNIAAIKRKLDNYYMLRCNLHVKFVINASPFYYGGICAAYNPLYVFNTTIPYAGSELNTISQRPCVWLYPQNSQGGELVLPFVYHKNFFDATDNTDLQQMGNIDMYSAGILRNANTVAGTDVDIQVFAWASELELAGPTNSLSLQSKAMTLTRGAKDEYQHDGAISKTASAVARYANQLSSIPWLTPYATATSFASGAVANIAAIFGYTRVPNVADVDFYKPSALPHFASTDIGEPIEKLTLDSKNELSIDSQICGVSLNDELNISSIVTREFYLSDVAWASTDVFGSDLYNMQISPHLLKAIPQTQQTTVIFSPMSYVSKLFDYWRGDIIIRLKFICSKFHKGRVHVSWDPRQANWGDSITNITTTAYSQIVDISKDTDVEFRIPYTQPTAYLPTVGSTTNGNYYSSGGSAGKSDFANGNLLIKVLNQQTSPVANADVRILVFARGADNMEFASPRDIWPGYSPYIVQSAEQEYEYEGDMVVSKNMGVKPSSADASINLVHMGETVPSLRPLIQRTSIYTGILSDSIAFNESARHRVRLPRLPLYPGFDTDGVNLANELVGASTAAYNFVAWSPMSWLSLAFVGQRGSIDYYLRPINDAEGGHTSIARSNSGSNTDFTFSWVTTAPVFTEREISIGRSGAAGLAVAHYKVNPCCAASVPMYSRYKFLNNNPLLRTLGSALDATDTDKVAFESVVSRVDTGTTKLGSEVYIKAGADFSFIFFRNAPILRLYDSIPTAA